MKIHSNSLAEKKTNKMPKRYIHTVKRVYYYISAVFRRNKRPSQFSGGLCTGSTPPSSPHRTKPRSKAWQSPNLHGIWLSSY
jgi:hypothetical protein